MNATDEKKFATLAAQYALCGHPLVRARPDQSAHIYACRRGYIKPLPSLNAAVRFLHEIGGA